ncbi:MAG: Gfo/Idh/MocA family oxidoreductase [Sphingobium sp.]|nr:Gfo/Idh/MocA family oxidoreductase [Sphingobium sp.]
MIGLGVGAALAMGEMARAQGGGAAKVERAKDSVGVAIVGIGLLSAGQLLPALTRTKKAHLAALVSGDPAKAQRTAAQYGLGEKAIYTYQSFDKLADNPDVEVVYVVLPNNMHREYTERAFKAGKHVLCEKPLANTVADAEAMVAAAKASKKHLMTAYRCHYEPLNLASMRIMRSGALGKPRVMHANMGKQTDLKISSDAWRLDMKMSGGGALFDMGIYGINAQRYLLNEEPVEVRAWAMTDKSDPRFKTVEDMIAWQMRFPSGAIGEGNTCFSQPGTMAWQMVCENGRIVADPGCFYNGNKLSLIGTQTRTPQIVEIDQFAREIDWMADVVRGRAPMVSPGEEGLQDMRIMTAMLQSAARSGATVKTDFGYKRAVDPAAVVDVPGAA